jgi:hypothetical protein
VFLALRTASFFAAIAFAIPMLFVIVAAIYSVPTGALSVTLGQILVVCAVVGFVVLYNALLIYLAALGLFVGVPPIRDRRLAAPWGTVSGTLFLVFVLVLLLLGDPRAVFASLPWWTFPVAPVGALLISLPLAAAFVSYRRRGYA